MTITANDERVQLVATGGETSVPFDFELLDEAHLDVLLTRAGVDSTLVLSTDYTVSGVGNDAGGSITLVVAATAGDVYTLESNTPVARATNFATGGDLLAGTVNTEFDWLVKMISQVARDVGRCLRLPVTDTEDGANYALPADRALRSLAFDANGRPVASTLADATKFGIQFNLDTVSDNTFTVDEDAGFGYTIDSAALVTSSGTVTVAVKIGGVDITAMDAIAVTAGKQTVVATGANTVAADDVVTIVTSSNASGSLLSIKLNCTRT